MPKKLILVCLINFLIAALMGLVLRYSFIEPININYRFLTHAHSHTAMLGWVYLMLFILIVHYFVPEKKPIFLRLFWLTEFAVIGMIISFPLQGYAAVSITFSTLHILCSYYFAYLVWKYHKTQSLVTRYLLRASLLFMLLSTIGVWCLGPAVGLLGQTSAVYQIAIQFFLHFQFNGWFLIAIIAIFFKLLKIEDSKLFRRFFKLLIVSTFLTLALPIQWFTPNNILLWINDLGVLTQLLALYYFVKLIKIPFYNLLHAHSKIVGFMYQFALVCFGIKISFQALSIFPEISEMAYQYRNFVIGFIHLTMLGVISGFIFAFLLQATIIKPTKMARIGINSFIIGFITTEFILIIQACLYYFDEDALPHYFLLLFSASVLLPLGICLLIYTIINQKKHA